MHIGEGDWSCDQHGDALIHYSRLIAKVQHIFGKPLFEAIGLIHVPSNLQADFDEDGEWLSQVWCGVDFIHIAHSWRTEDLLNQLGRQRHRTPCHMLLTNYWNQVIELLKFVPRHQSPQPYAVPINQPLLLGRDPTCKEAAVTDSRVELERHNECEGPPDAVHPCHAGPDVVGILKFGTLRLGHARFTPSVTCCTALQCHTHQHNKLPHAEEGLREVSPTVPVAFRCTLRTEHQKVRHCRSKDGVS
mmetsp:Transcript_109933/g.306361  ORF Transcript_109933/g.306361 Transcript_109933/m.306361 type:complete len:246 (+) Transcript_109933:257-994(+)